MRGIDNNFSSLMQGTTFTSIKEQLDITDILNDFDGYSTPAGILVEHHPVIQFKMARDAETIKIHYCYSEGNKTFYKTIKHIIGIPFDPITIDFKHDRFGIVEWNYQTNQNYYTFQDLNDQTIAGFLTDRSYAINQPDSITSITSINHLKTDLQNSPVLITTPSFYHYAIPHYGVQIGSKIYNVNGFGHSTQGTTANNNNAQIVPDQRLSSEPSSSDDVLINDTLKGNYDTKLPILLAGNWNNINNDIPVSYVQQDQRHLYNVITSIYKNPQETELGYTVKGEVRECLFTDPDAEIYVYERSFNKLSQPTNPGSPTILPYLAASTPNALIHPFNLNYLGLTITSNPTLTTYTPGPIGITSYSNYVIKHATHDLHFFGDANYPSVNTPSKMLTDIIKTEFRTLTFPFYGLASNFAVRSGKKETFSSIGLCNSSTMPSNFSTESDLGEAGATLRVICNYPTINGRSGYIRFADFQYECIPKVSSLTSAQDLTLHIRNVETLSNIAHGSFSSEQYSKADYINTKFMPVIVIKDEAEKGGGSIDDGLKLQNKGQKLIAGLQQSALIAHINNTVPQVVPAFIRLLGDGTIMYDFNASSSSERPSTGVRQTKNEGSYSGNTLSLPNYTEYFINPHDTNGQFSTFNYAIEFNFQQNTPALGHYKDSSTSKQLYIDYDIGIHNSYTKYYDVVTYTENKYLQARAVFEEYDYPALMLVAFTSQGNMPQQNVICRYEYGYVEETYSGKRLGITVGLVDDTESTTLQGLDTDNIGHTETLNYAHTFYKGTSLDSRYESYYKCKKIFIGDVLIYDSNKSFRPKDNNTYRYGIQSNYRGR